MDNLADRLASAYASSPLMFWAWGSVLAYTLATNTLWLLKSTSFWRSPYSRWLAQAGRFLFYLGIPYLALGGWPRQPYQGLFSLEDMGIVGLDAGWPVTRWLGATGTGLGIGLAALLILALAWANANRRGEGIRLSFPSRPAWALLVDGLYLEVHWAFYRGALAVALDDVYGGVFGGLGLVYLEWGVNPLWRRGWRQESQSARQWLRAALALVAALLFLLTRNLWVCLGVHWLLTFTFWYVAREQVQRTEETAGRSPSIPSSPAPGNPTGEGHQPAVPE